MCSNVGPKRLSDSAVFDVLDFLEFFLDSRTGVVFYKLFYPTAQMITFVFPAEAFGKTGRVVIFQPLQLLMN